MTDTGSTLMECYEEGLHIVVVAWKGKTSVRAYVAKCDRIHYLRLCGADLSKYGKFPNGIFCGRITVIFQLST